MMIGIDFGTTNSGAAIYTPQRETMIETVEGQDTMPSAVAQTDTGFVTGQAAIRQQNENPEFTFKSIKRYLGVDYDENEHGHFQLAEGPDGKVWWKGRAGLISGPQLVAEVLKSIMTATEFKLRERPTGAVIGIPVDFGEQKQMALRDAAMLAGFIDVHLFREPYCAALSFGVTEQGFSHIAVYDLGGGTFDVTILAMKDGVTDAKAMNGIGYLGGVDFDKRLVDHCVDMFFRDEGEDLRTKPDCMIRLTREAEETKKALSNYPDARVYLEGLTWAGDGGLKSMNYSVTRDELVELTKDLVVRTIAATEDALDQAKLTKRDIKHVLMVGGQSRMPLIHEVLGAMFGKKKITMGPKPEHAVALGAARRAAEIQGIIKPGVLGLIAPMTLGLRRSGGVCVPLIAKGSKYPAREAVELKTVQGDQGQMEIIILEGESPTANMNTQVCRSVVEIEALPEGELTVSLVAEADASGALRITVNDQVIYGQEAGA